MNCKSIFIKTSLVVLMMAFSPSMSLSATTEGSVSNSSSGFYIGTQYKPGLSIFSNFTITEDMFDVKGIFGLKHDATANAANNKTAIAAALETNTNFQGVYKPSYNNSLTGLSGLIGYTSNSGLRIEFEGSYENFAVKDPGNCKLKEAYRYFAIASAVTQGKEEPQDKKYSVMKANDITDVSVLVNLCYDFAIDSFAGVNPYLCVGGGASFIEVFNALNIRFAYQAKAGASYSLTSDVSLFADAYFEGISNSKFKGLYSINPKAENTTPSVNVVDAKFDFNYFGGEVGVRFTF